MDRAQRPGAAVSPTDPLRGAGSGLRSRHEGTLCCSGAKTSSSITRNWYRVEARRAKACPRHAGADAGAAATERSLVSRLRVGSAGRWSPLPHPDDRRRAACRRNHCTPENIARIADTSLSGLRVPTELDRLVATRGKPRMIVSDYCTGFTSNAILRWADQSRVKWHCWKRLCETRLQRVVQRVPVRRTPGRDAVHHARPGSRAARSVACRLQRRSPTRIRGSAGRRRPSSPAPSRVERRGCVPRPPAAHPAPMGNPTSRSEPRTG